MTNHEEHKNLTSSVLDENYQPIKWILSSIMRLYVMTLPTKSRSVTIRVKADEKYFDVILFVLEYFENEISIRVIFFWHEHFCQSKTLGQSFAYTSG